MNGNGPQTRGTGETELFRNSWTLYDAITDRNYMFHRELYTTVARVLGERGSSRFSLLDLGCGNARFLAPCLRGKNLSGYTGVDLSATALDEAADHLAGIDGISLRQAEMLGYLEEEEEPFDIIFSGFALHHLQTGEKGRFLQRCRERLATGGILLLLDVVRAPGEDRDAYLRGYVGFMRSEWTGLSPDHLEEACSHVNAYDFLETLETLSELANQAGFRDTALIDRRAQHHLIRFST